MALEIKMHHRNIIHGSDGPETAVAEIGLWFKPEELVNYTHNAEKWLYEWRAALASNFASTETMEESFIAQSQVHVCVLRRPWVFYAFHVELFNKVHSHSSGTSHSQEGESSFEPNSQLLLMSLDGAPWGWGENIRTWKLMLFVWQS